MTSHWLSTICYTLIYHLRDWSGTGTSLEHSSRDDSDVNADQPWSIPFTTGLNNFLSNVYTTKYVQNICQTEQRRILALSVTSYIISLTAGILALPILSWWLRKYKQRRQACENVCTVNAGRAICRYQNNLHGTNSNRNTYGIGFCMH